MKNKKELLIAGTLFGIITGLFLALTQKASITTEIADKPSVMAAVAKKTAANQSGITKFQNEETNQSTAPIAVVQTTAKQTDAKLNVFGEHGEVTLANIPKGRFRDEVTALDPATIQKVLKALETLRIPVLDVNSLHVTKAGDLFYACPGPAKIQRAALPSGTGTMRAAISGTGNPVPPILHSRTGTTKSIYLDFGGRTLRNTSWSTGNIVCSPFDTDGDPTTFSPAEQTAITDIWSKVANHYAAFDVDVTTEEPPAAQAYTTTYAMITNSVDPSGNLLPSNTAGGVAFIGVFGTDSGLQYPCFIYTDNVQEDSNNIADAAAHEVGHTMGLSHDGLTTPVTEYYSGNGTGNTSWGPIMGAPYSRTITQWSKGEYYSANNPQDQIAIIAAKLSLRADKIGSTAASAQALIVDGNGNFNTPGFLESGSDVNVFVFSITNQSVIGAQLAPFHGQSDKEGAALYGVIQLLAADGTVVATSGQQGTDQATLTQTIAPGTYYIQVSGTGYGTPMANPALGFTGYGSQGNYSVSGNFHSPTAPIITMGSTSVTASATGQSIRVTGTIDGNGSATTYYCRYGTSMAYGSQTQTLANGSGVSPITNTITGLLPQSTYHIQVVATNSNGTTYGNDTVGITTFNFPEAITGVASQIGGSTATLSGTCNPNGTTAWGYFQWGTTTSYYSGNQAGGTFHAGSGEAVASLNITGLALATTYHWRFYAENNSGTTFGADQTFTTASANAPNAISSPATNTTCGQTTLVGQINSWGAPATYHFEYGTDTNFGTSTPTMGGAFTGLSSVYATITGLTASTQYHYRLVATTTGGTTYSDSQVEDAVNTTFTTAAPGAPSSTTGKATVVSPTSLILNGTVNPNELTTNYYFQYGADTSYGNNSQSTNAGNGYSPVSATALVENLNPMSTIHYQLVAVNTSGTTYGGDQIGTGGNPPPTATTTAASGIHFNAVDINGNVNPNGQATTYYFQYGTSANYTSQTITQSAGAENTSLPVTAALSGLSANTTYHYRVVAINGSGTSTGEDQFFTTSPTPPSPGISITPVTGITANSSTVNATVNPNGLASTYYFQYGTSTNYTVANLPRAAGSGYLALPVSSALTGLNASTVYHYRFVAINSSGTSTSEDQSFTTSALPPAPATVTTAASGTTTSTSTLNGTVNPNGLATTCYFQFGTSASYGSSTPVLNVGTGTGISPVQATVGGLTPSTIYHFQLVAASTSGTSWGGDQSFTTADPPPTNVDLGVLSTSIGSVTPVLAHGQTSYTLNVANTVKKGTVTAVSEISGNRVRMIANGKSTELLQKATTAVTLGIGANQVGITVTATNGKTQAYTLTINRVAAPITGIATQIQGQMATLNATVDGHSTQVSFQYGATTKYGSASAVAAINGSGGMNTSVGIPISGLIAGTVCHYRVVNTTGSSTLYGADKIFVTAENQPETSVETTGSSPAGIPEGKFAAIGNPTINESGVVAFKASVSGKGISNSNNIGIWMETSLGTSLIARLGTQVSGGILTALGDPVLNNQNQIAFAATTTLANKTQIKGIWMASGTTSLIQVVAQGESLIGASGSSETIASLGNFTLTDQNKIVVVVNLSGSTTNQGIWQFDSEGQAGIPIQKGYAIEPNGPAVTSLAILDAPATVAGQSRSINNAGTITLMATFADGSQGIYAIEQDQTLERINKTGDTAPTRTEATTLSRFSSPILNDKGNVAFKASIAGTAGVAPQTGIWMESGTERTLVLIAETGVPMPYTDEVNNANSGTFSAVLDPVFNNSETVAFTGTMNNSQAVWVAGTNGALNRIAEVGSQAPDCQAGTKFNGFTQIAINEKETIVVGTVTGPAGSKVSVSGVWMTDNTGKLHIIAKTGDVVGFVNGKAKSITGVSMLNAAGTAQTRNFNKSGSILFVVTYSDKSEEILEVPQGK